MEDWCPGSFEGTFWLFYYNSQKTLQEGNVFTLVCHSVHRGVSLPTMPWSRQTPPPPPPKRQTSLRRQTVPPPDLQDTDTTVGCGQQVGGTHPTGMHTCDRYLQALQFLLACKSHLMRLSWEWIPDFKRALGENLTFMQIKWHKNAHFQSKHYFTTPCHRANQKPCGPTSRHIISLSDNEFTSAERSLQRFSDCSCLSTVPWETI